MCKIQPRRLDAPSHAPHTYKTTTRAENNLGGKTLSTSRRAGSAAANGSPLLLELSMQLSSLQNANEHHGKPAPRQTDLNRPPHCCGWEERVVRPSAVASIPIEAPPWGRTFTHSVRTPRPRRVGEVSRCTIRALAEIGAVRAAELPRANHEYGQRLKVHHDRGEERHEGRPVHLPA